MTEWLSWIPVVIQVLIALGTFFVLWRKATPEIQVLRTEAEANEAKANTDEAKAAESYANAAKLVADEMIAVREEMKRLRKEVDDRDIIIAERDKIIMEYQTTLDDTKNWAERLVYQIKSLGADPVPFRMTKSPPK